MKAKQKARPASAEPKPQPNGKVIRLRDGIERSFRWTIFEMALSAQTFGNEIFSGENTNLMRLRAALWAGLYLDAQRRGDTDWTPERVDELVPIESINALGEQVRSFIAEAVSGPLGES